MKFGIGVVGLVAVAAISLGFMWGNWVKVLFGGVGVFVGMFLLKVFAASKPKVARIDVSTAVKVILWAVVVSLLIIIAFGVGKVALLLFVGGSAEQRPNSPAVAEVPDTPTLPGEYPSIDEIIDLPDKEEVERRPPVPPEDVNFRYRNATGIPMKLVLFNCHYHYFPLEDEPLAPKGSWRSWDFPATNKFLTCSDFERGTGWYVFFVLRPDTGEYWQLGTKNIFYSDWPTLTVESTGDKKEPFKAVFSSSGANDGAE